MKALNGRLETLSLIAAKGLEIEYSDTGFISPNRWISSAIIHDFESRGLIQRSGTQAVVTEKGLRLLSDAPGPNESKRNQQKGLEANERTLYQIVLDNGRKERRLHRL